ncbi:hypothetical protein Syun_030675 [Stephania yunnanensis]|uniref:Uncharacterized protein n=1 Tax=Stephania yunnanensis TaxID=152371 RepID=A0AAP0HE70_9MAGN
MIVAVSQIIAIAVASLAIAFRRFGLEAGRRLHQYGVLEDEVQDGESIIISNLMFGLDYLLWFRYFWKVVLMIIVLSISFWIAIPCLVLNWLVWSVTYEWDCKDEHEEAREEFKDLIGEGDRKLDAWTLRNGADGMQRWIEKPKALNELIKLLSTNPPSLEIDQSPICQLKAHYDLVRSGYQISSLSILLHVWIATVSTPCPLNGSLLNSLDEVFEILHFVDRKMSSMSFETKMRSMFARALWRNGKFNNDFDTIDKDLENNDAF